LLAKASSLAYQSSDVIEPEFVQWGFPQFTFIDRKDSQAFMAGNAEMIIIAFWGTEPTTLWDWMTDVKIPRKNGPYGKVHRGFLKGFQVVWLQIRPVINEWQTQAQSLWLTGHSLGPE
jgi:triacylglycerol lipase